MSLIPIITNGTRTADAGESLVLTGGNFTSATQFFVSAKTGTGSTVKLQADVLEIDDNSVTLRLPQTLPLDTVYNVTAKNGALESASFSVNDAEAWWVGPNKLVAGEETSIFGRNLMLENQSSGVQVEIRDAQGRVTQVTETEINPYKVGFNIPQNLAPGDYDIRVTNGKGGAEGWSDYIKVTIEAPVNYSANTLNVRNFGAKGDGVTDDSKAFFDAVQEAVKSGTADTIIIPSGTYVISNGLWLGNGNIKFIGYGEGATQIIAHENFGKTSAAEQIDGVSGNNYVFSATNAKNIVIENLSLDISKVAGTDSGVMRGLYVNGSENITVNNVTITGGAHSGIHINKGSHLTFQDVNYSGERFFLGEAEQVKIDNLTIETRGNAAISGVGVRDLSITNSNVYAEDGQLSSGRFFVDQAHSGVSMNHYYAGNTTHDLAVDANHPDQNQGEQILWEHNAVYFSSGYNNSDDSSKTHTILATGTNTLQLGGIEHNKVTYQDWESKQFQTKDISVEGMTVTVVGGTGLGQIRFIKTVDPQTGIYTLDRAWDVVPDINSEIVVGRFMTNAVVYNNHLDGRDDTVANEDYNASHGILAYKGNVNTIIDNNTFSDLRYGIGMFNDDKPNLLTQISNNTFDNTRWAVYFATGFFEQHDKIPEGEYNLGVRITGNDFGNPLVADISYQGPGQFTNFEESPNLTPHLIVDNNVFGDGKADVSFVHGWQSTVIEFSSFANNKSAAGAAVTFNHIYEGTQNAETIQGTSNNEVIRGGHGSDSITAGAGNDLIIGGAYVARLSAHAERDMIDAGEGNDTVFGFDDGDRVWGREGNDSLVGEEGDDSLMGHEGNDTLLGGNGNDSLEGGIGADMLNGGAGNDTVYYTGNANLTVDLSTGTSSEGDTLIGIEAVDASLTTGNDLLIGTAGANTLLGGSGNDTLEGGAGTDVLNGGQNFDFVRYRGSANMQINLADGTNQDGDSFTDIEGIDVSLATGANRLTGDYRQNHLIGGTGGDSLLGGAGNDTLEGGAGNDSILGENDNDTIYGGLGNDTLIGGSHYDSIFGGDGHDRIDGGSERNHLFGEAGNDTIIGGGSNNSIDGGADNDSILGGDGNENMAGGAGNDTVNGMAGGDEIVGNSGNDSITGGAGSDILLGNEGMDTINGGLDNDTIDGGADNDVIDGGDGWDDITGMAGNDSIKGGAGRDTIFGGDGSDTMEGGDDRDSLNGANSNDSITAGAGDDTLVGGAGDDTLQGGADVDTYSFATAGYGNDVVTDSGINNLVFNGVRLSGTSVYRNGTHEISVNGTTFLLTRQGADVMVRQSGNTTDGVLLKNFVSGDFGINLSLGDSIMGNDSDNLLIGTNGGDTLFGYNGDDTIEGGSGSDRMEGGNGIDTARYSGSGWVNIQLGTSSDGDTLVGFENVDASTATGNYTITGTTGHNLLIGGAGNDLLLGGDNGGNDTLEGGAGIDTLDGGAGGDRDTARYSGSTNLNISLSRTITGGDIFIGIEDVDASRTSGNNTIEGSNVRNILVGGSGRDSIMGGDGFDTLEGGAGNDTLDGGAGNDVARYTGTRDYVLSLAPNSGGQVFADGDLLVGIEGLDLSLAVGNHRLTGSAAQDRLIGGAGNDTLEGGLHGDSLVGGDGFDTALYRSGDNMIINLVTGSRGGDAGFVSASGGVIPDTFTSMEAIDASLATGNNEIVGDTNANLLRAGSGKDTLEGGGGNDTLEGGAGVDTYRFATGQGQDVIVDSGSNQLLFNGLQITGTATRTSSGVEMLVGGSKFFFDQSSEGVKITQQGNSTDSVLLKNFQNGDFGLTIPVIQATTNAKSLVLGTVKMTTALGTSESITAPDGFNITDNRLLPTIGEAKLFEGNFSNSNDTFGIQIANTPDARMELYGNGGDDLIGIAFKSAFASSDSNRIEVDGGTGNDTLVTLSLTQDNSRVYLRGGEGNDRIYGYANYSHLYGGAGEDVMYGGLYNTLYVSATGADKLYGNVGVDTFYFRPLDSNNVQGRDTIYNFDVTKDWIQLNMSDMGVKNFTIDVASSNHVVIGTADNSFAVDLVGFDTTKIHLLDDRMQMNVGSTVEFI